MNSESKIGRFILVFIQWQINIKLSGITLKLWLDLLNGKIDVNRFFFSNKTRYYRAFLFEKGFRLETFNIGDVSCT